MLHSLKIAPKQVEGDQDNSAITMYKTDNKAPAQKEVTRRRSNGQRESCDREVMDGR